MAFDVILCEDQTKVTVVEDEVHVATVAEPGPPGRPGVGQLPTGGATDSVLAKASPADSDVKWLVLAVAALTGDYNDLLNLPTLGTAASKDDDYFLNTASELSDLPNKGNARQNLGVEIGVDVQAWSAILDAVAANTYIGSTSITTLGTISTGVWNATTIAINKGGTGATTANAALNNLLPTQTGHANKYLMTDGTNTSWQNNPLGTVTSFTFTNANGIAGVVTDPNTTPNLTLSLGNITPTSVTASGTVTGSNLSGTNTGDVTLAGQNYLSILNQVITANAVDLSGTNATGTLAAARFPALTGDLTTTAGSLATTLATVNSDVGTWGSGSETLSITVNAKGLVTAVSEITIDITASQVSNFTEAAQDAVGAMVDSTLVYVDNTPLLTRAAITGDISIPQASNTATLATVNSNVGVFGSSTAIPTITVNAKGLVTAVTTNAVIAPAGTLTGTTLAANVVSSSLTSVGTIVTGVWNGTTIAVANGGTGQTTANAALNALLPVQTGQSGKYLQTDGTNASWVNTTIGTVTSVDVSGGTTGLSFSGGPITTNGTITMAGTLGVANGGSGANTLTGVLIGNGTSAFTTKTNPTGAFVGTTDTQTLTNKSFEITGSATLALAATQFNISAGVTPTAGNIYALTLDKAGTQTIMLGINKNSTTNGIPANSIFLSSYTTSGTVSIGRGNGAGQPSTADIFVNTDGNVSIGNTSSGAKLQVQTADALFATVALNVSSSTSSTLLTVRASGSAAFGTTPTSTTKLTVRGQNSLSNQNALVVQNSGPTDLFTVRNDGAIFFVGNQLTVSATADVSGTNTGDVTLAGQNYLSIVGQVITAAAVDLSGTNATGTLAAGRFPALTGDVTTSAGSLATTLATVNSDVGTYANATVTVNGKGLVTAVVAGYPGVPSSAAGGTANAITASYTPAVTSLVDGMILEVVSVSATTTTAPTFTPNNGVVAAYAIVKKNNQTLVTGDIPGSGAGALLQWNAALTKWVLLNPAKVVSGDINSQSATNTQVLTANGSSAATWTSITSAYVTDFVEAAQDAVGTMVDSTLVYVDATPLLTRAAITGDVTIAQGSNASTIATNVVSNTKLAQMATMTIKGNNTGGTANAADLTVTQTTAMLNAFVGDSGSGGTKGLVPAPSAGDGAAGKLLSANGTWVVGGGKIVDAYRQVYTSYTSGLSANIPFDNSIPQVGEGTQIFSFTFTPKKSTNRFMFIGCVVLGGAAGNVQASATFFLNGAANAIAMCPGYISSSGYPVTVPVAIDIGSIGNTSSNTITIRCGVNSGNYSINGGGALQYYGGAVFSSMELLEIDA